MHVDESVRAERAVVGVFVVVAAVGEEADAPSVQADAVGVLPHALVDPVPDAAARKLVVLVEEVPVLLQVAHPVAHRALVFHLEVGTRIGQLLAQPVERHVLSAGHVRSVVPRACAPVGRNPTHAVERTRGIELLHRFVAFRDARAPARLVADGPHHHARAVAVEVHVPDIAFQHRLVPLLALRHAIRAVPHAVRLHVGLAHHIDAVAVAQIVHPPVVRIVRHAYAVDVVPAHEPHVLLHLFEGERVAVLGAHLVAVHALELHGAAVHEDASAVHLAFAHADANAPSVAEVEHVEIRILVGPQARRSEAESQALPAFRHKRADLLAIGVEQMRTSRRDSLFAADQLKPTRPVRILRVRNRREREVGNAVQRLGIERHVAENAGIADHVLILRIAAVAPFPHARLDGVSGSGAEIHERRHVELRGQASVLKIADFLPVDPYLAA